MQIPTFITHYFERDRGPFLNICDLPEPEVARIFDSESKADTAFNRFALGDDFMRWRRAADDLLIQAYFSKFGFHPTCRPFFAVLGRFDKTMTMFREGDSLALDLDIFHEHEVTFMYPDHAHLTGFYGAEVPHLFYQLEDSAKTQGFRGQLFTYSELCERFTDSGIADLIRLHKDRDGWAGCYVEAHIWCRDARTNQPNKAAHTNPLPAPSPNFNDDFNP